MIVSYTFFVFLQCVGEARKVHETTTLLLVTLPNIDRLKKFTRTLSNKPFLIWLLTTQPDLKYVATLLCNLSIITCFADINVSQGSVATCASCGKFFSIHLTANLLRILPVKKCENRLRLESLSRSFCAGVAIRYVLPVLWMTIYLHTIASNRRYKNSK